jgi:hypothetical protein
MHRDGALLRLLNELADGPKHQDTLIVVVGNQLRPEVAARAYLRRARRAAHPIHEQIYWGRRLVMYTLLYRSRQLGYIALRERAGIREWRLTKRGYTRRVALLRRAHTQQAQVNP